VSATKGCRAGLEGFPEPADEVKVCCANAYQSDAVALILGDSYHPGGPALSRRLAEALALRPGERVADIASGPGTTAVLLAGEVGVEVDGVELSETSVAVANAKAIDAGLGDRVRFYAADAERLPLADGTVDAVVCECALCTFPNKAVAAAEMARVLKPGGRLGITDVTLDPRRLDSELASLAGWVACIADARPVDDYCQYLEGAGLEVILTEAHDGALARMIETIDARPGRHRPRRRPPKGRRRGASGRRWRRRLLAHGGREALAPGSFSAVSFVPQRHKSHLRSRRLDPQGAT
jgi:arsenite methyltransferase